MLSESKKGQMIDFEEGVLNQARRELEERLAQAIYEIVPRREQRDVSVAFDTHLRQTLFGKFEFEFTKSPSAKMSFEERMFEAFNRADFNIGASRRVKYWGELSTDIAEKLHTSMSKRDIELGEAEKKPKSPTTIDTYNKDEE